MTTITYQEPSQFSKRLRVTVAVIPIFSFVLALIHMMGNGWNAYGVIAILVAVVTWCKAYIDDMADTFFKCVMVCIVSTTLLLSPCFLLSTTANRIWLNTNSKTTTLSQLFIVTMPFESEFVATRQGGKEGKTFMVSSKTIDGIPLTCTVNMFNVFLNEQEGKKLEKILFDIAERHGDIQTHIDETLKKEVGAAVSSVIATKTSEQVANLQQFYLPYKAGTVLGNTIPSLGLKWDNGGVKLSCAVLFNS